MAGESIENVAAFGTPTLSLQGIFEHGHSPMLCVALQNENISWIGQFLDALPSQEEPFVSHTQRRNKSEQI